MHPKPDRSIVSGLLQPDEPPAVEVVNPVSDATALFICDHASRRLPRSLGSLGLTQAQLESHIGWDIGAAGLARRVAARLSATLVLSGYSRLAIDCNRPLAAPGSIPAESAGIPIPGNAALTPAAVADRRRVFFEPYHQTIADLLDHRRAVRRPTALFSIHSFTPDYPGEVRPWHVDFAYNRDRRLAGLLLDAIDRHGLVVGDNQPYKVEDDDDCSIPQHGERRGIPHVLIEIRQDMLSDETGIAVWADRLTELIVRLGPQIDRIARESMSV